MNYDNFTLETERLLFRPPHEIDLDAFCKMEQDPDVRRYVGGEPRSRKDAERRFLNGLKPVNNGLSMWATILKSENKYIGRCGIYPHFNQDANPIMGEASLGLYIAKQYWGRGLATEAGGAFVDFGFHELKLKRIVTMIDARNEVSVHVIKKLGFQLESTELGEYRSFYHYELKNPML